jgi:flagellar hook-associated protein 3 FlgL
MIQSLDPSSQEFLVSLTRIQSAIKRTNDQISSGLKVNAPSDAPDQISDILQLYTDLGQNAQIQTNLGRIKSEVGTAETILESAIKIVDRAMTLGSQGAGTMQSAEARLILADDVQSQLEQLVSASRTIVAGRYIFSGDQNQEPAYELDLLNLNANGVNRLLMAPSTRLIQHASGASFTAGKTAMEVFDARNADDSLAPDNVFAAVNGLRTALENNDQAGIDASLSALRAAGDHLNIELGFYGTVQNNIDEAIDFSAQLDVRLKTELSSRRDADITAAILELEQGKTQQQAAFTARAEMPRTSLFDFLR